MKIGIFGCGAYGMALSSILHENGHHVTMWTKFTEEKTNLIKNNGNPKLLPNFKLPKDIIITTSIEDTIKDKDLLIIAIPAAFVRDLIVQMAFYIKDNHILIATKGIEQDTGLFISEIINECLNTTNVSVISGPSFAIDLISHHPIGLSIAVPNKNEELLIKTAFVNSHLKLRTNDDIIGTEICGSIKNVIAISAGMLDGLGVNESTKAMFLTETLHDFKEILSVFKANRNTALSFAGFGDLLLTCTSPKSRNFTFGKLIGSHASKKEITNYLSTTTVEGYYTLKSIYKLLQDKQVSIPIIDLIYDIVMHDTNPDTLLSFLINKE